MPLRPCSVIIGASGALGSAFVTQVLAREGGPVFALARNPYDLTDQPGVTRIPLDLTDEISIKAAAKSVSEYALPCRVIVASGLLHNQDVKPEKAIHDISIDNFVRVFAVNTFGPALVIKHFLPILPKTEPGIFAVISARVGSISDNRLGGWYAYRASKAALNMLIKSASIELARRNDQSLIVGLHPGTVDSALSKPFQERVQPDQLFTPEYSATRMLAVLDNLTPADSGKCFAYDGNEIPA